MDAERRRVLFLVPSLIAGGAQRVFCTLLRHLDRERFEIHLAVLQAAGVYLADVPTDVVIHDLKVSRIRYAAPSLVRIAWKLRPQVVLSTLVYLNLQLLLARPFFPRGTKVLVRESTTASVFLRHETRHPTTWKWMYRHLYDKADRVICLSDAMVDDLVKNFNLPPEKLVRIYNPVDFEMVRKLADANDSPHSGPGPHLVTAGRLSWEKGIDVLLRAMPSVLEVFPETRLSILGEGPLEGELRQQATDLGLTQAVEFLGFRQNPWPYLKHAEVFVLPSRYEGLPNALVEALALGARAVVADCPGAMREIEDPGGQIVMAAPENPEALARAILDQCKRTSPCGHPVQSRESFLKKFSLQQVVGEYADLLLT